MPTTSDLGYDMVSDIGVMQRVVLAPAGVPEDRLKILRDAFAKLKNTQDTTDRVPVLQRSLALRA